MNPGLVGVITVIIGIRLTVADWYLGILLGLKRDKSAGRPALRKPFPKEQMWRISRGQCNLGMYCGVYLNRNNLTIDHIHPLDRPGKTDKEKNDESNLQVLCRFCNSSKGNQTDGDSGSVTVNCWRHGVSPRQPEYRSANFVTSLCVLPEPKAPGSAGRRCTGLRSQKALPAV